MSFIEKVKGLNKDIFSNILCREYFPMLINHMGYKKVCEIGVNEGYFLKVLSMANIEHLVGVDVWDRYDMEAYKTIPAYYSVYPHEKNKFWRKNVEEWAEKMSYRVDIIVDFSTEAANKFEDDFFDFVYIDADHTYDSVTKDLESWWPKVRTGGMLSGHDYINMFLEGRGEKTICRAKDAVDDFIEKYHKLDLLSTTKEIHVNPSFLILK